MLVRLLAATVLAAAVLVPGPVTAGAAEPAPPGAPYLVRDGHTWAVHDGATSIQLPDSIVDNGQEMPPQYGVFRLLGKVDAAGESGYVLVELVGPTAYDGGLTELALHVLHPDGTADTFLELDGRARGQRVRLSDDGRAVWVFHDDVRTGMDQSLVVRLDGRTTALPDTRRHVLDLPTARTPVSAGPGARIADVADDLLVRRTDGTTEVGRLSRPDRVRWTTPLRPLAGNARTVLLAGSPLELRRVRDGALVTTFDTPDPDQVVWEDAGHLLLADGTGVVRCGLDGSCATVVAGLVTLPGATGPRWPGTPA